MLRRLLREPLLHFLAVGGVFFIVFGGEKAPPDTATKIVVTASDVERLAGSFTRTWRRPPSDQELQATIEDYIREEVLYRVGISLGLDQDDTIIRRRLRQKMEFLFEDTVPEPRETDLRAFFHVHEDRFRAEPRISFRHVFMSSGRGDTAEGDARQILARLVAAGFEATDEGDPSLLADGFDQAPLSRIGSLFGDAFARQIAEAEPGRWSGPLKSAYGYHLVLLTEVMKERLPPFEEVRDAVRREWFAERRAAALDEQYRTLRARYQVHVDYPPDATRRP